MIQEEVMRKQFSIMFIISLIMACETVPHPGEPALYLRVYDDRGNPVQSATIIVNNQSSHVITDGYGRAIIPLRGLDSPLHIEVHHSMYLTARIENDVQNEILFVTLRSRGMLVQKSYHLAKKGQIDDALQILTSEPGFTATNTPEYYYMALLYYLSGDIRKSQEMLNNITEPIPAKQSLLQLMEQEENTSKEEAL